MNFLGQLRQAENGIPEEVNNSFQLITLYKRSLNPVALGEQTLHQCRRDALTWPTCVNRLFCRTCSFRHHAQTPSNCSSAST